jgi:hypothetical protein
VRARGDRRLDGRPAPARERPDGRHEHVAALDERAHRFRPLDVGDRPFEAAELGGERLDARLVARREHRLGPARHQRAGRQIARVAGSAEDDDPLCHGQRAYCPILPRPWTSACWPNG